MKLNPKRNGAGKVSSFTINIGSLEAQKLGWKSGEELEKVIKKDTLIIKRSSKKWMIFVIFLKKMEN